MISGDLKKISDVFVKLSQGQNSLEETELIMDALQNRVHPRQFVSRRNHSLLLVIPGIETHSSELHSTWVPKMDYLSALQYAIDATSEI